MEGPKNHTTKQILPPIKVLEKKQNYLQKEKWTRLLSWTEKKLFDNKTGSIAKRKN